MWLLVGKGWGWYSAYSCIGGFVGTLDIYSTHPCIVVLCKYYKGDLIVLLL